MINFPHEKHVTEKYMEKKVAQIPKLRKGGLNCKTYTNMEAFQEAFQEAFIVNFFKDPYALLMAMAVIIILLYPQYSTSP